MISWRLYNVFFIALKSLANLSYLLNNWLKEIFHILIIIINIVGNIQILIIYWKSESIETHLLFSYFLSSYGQNLMTSTFIGETSFAILIAILGLVLFAHLIGNMQVMKVLCPWLAFHINCLLIKKGVWFSLLEH